VSSSVRFLSPSAAAECLGVSVKALRLYERHGLMAPSRTPAGWRAYGPDDMSRAAEIASLRALGLGLTQIARVLADDPQGLEPALAAHQTTLEGRIRQLAEAVGKVRDLRADLARVNSRIARKPVRLPEPKAALQTGFALPWPWGGEWFELGDVRSLNYIIGPLGSGKTRLAMRLAEILPDATFLGLDRLERGGAVARAQLAADPAVKSGFDPTLAWLVDNGATASDALMALLVGLESSKAAIVVVDMIEQGLDRSTQEALIAWLRRRGPDRRPLFLMTRSTAILNLGAVSADETIILCPANHSPPTPVLPYPGAPGYEAVATCVASPEVRARTDGMISWRPQAA
jgi:DNA-binding transcriptional MerR regulator